MANFQTTTFQGEWKGNSAGGCVNFPTVGNNPQFFIKVTQSSKVKITLEQGGTAQNSAIGVVVADKKGERLKALYKGEQICSSGSYAPNKTAEVEFTFEPKEYAYTCFVSTFNPGEERPFTLTFVAEHPIEVSPAATVDPMAGLEHRVVKNGEWTAETAGGCINNATAKKNPQFLLKLTEKTRLFFTLKQLNTPPTSIGLLVVDKKGGRVEVLYTGEQVGSSGTYVNTPEVTAEMELDAKDYAYTVFVSSFEPGKVQPFQLVVNSSHPVTLDELPTFSEQAVAYAHTQTVHGEWKGPTAGGCTNHPTFINNPMYFLSVSEPTKVQISLTQKKKGEEKLHQIALQLCQDYNTCMNSQTIADSGRFTNLETVKLTHELTPHTHPYVVYGATFDAGKEAEFSVTVESDKPVRVEAHTVATAESAKKLHAISWPSAWKGPSAAGSFVKNPSGAYNNPQFNIKLPENADVTITVTQVGSTPLPISMTIYDNGGMRVMAEAPDRVVAATGPVQAVRDLTLTQDLEKKAYDYTLLINTDEAGQEDEFVISLRSDKRVTILEIADDVKLNQLQASITRK